MDFIRLAAAAYSGALGATNIITLTDFTSTGNYGRTAGVTIASNGAVYKYSHNAPVVVYNWISPLTNFSQYEVRATLSSGSTPDAGTIGSWEALSTSRTWTLTETVDDATDSSELLLEIRWTGDNSTQASATITLDVTGPPSGGGYTGGTGNNDYGGVEVF